MIFKSIARIRGKALHMNIEMIHRMNHSFRVARQVEIGESELLNHLCVRVEKKKSQERTFEKKRK